jgi:hypothetical protein
MNIPNRKEWRILHDRAWDHTARQYLIRCAEPAINKLAPLPEFQNALEWLKEYDSKPTDRNRTKLNRVLRELEAGRKTGRRNYGYTAVGECYSGLCHIIRVVLHPNRKWGISSCSTAQFAEAYYCAADATDPRVDWPRVCWAYSALHHAYDEHMKIWNELWGGFFAEFGNSWEEYQAKQRQVRAA